MKYKDIEENLPEWAKEYGRGESHWASDLTDVANLSESECKEWSAFFAGVGLAFFLLILNGDYYSGWNKWFIWMGFVVGGMGGMGWMLKLDRKKSPTDLYRETVMQWKARAKSYTATEVGEVKEYRDWLAAYYDTEYNLIEQSKSFNFIKEWKIWRLERSYKAEQIKLYDVFLHEIKLIRLQV